MTDGRLSPHVRRQPASGGSWRAERSEHARSCKALQRRGSPIAWNPNDTNARIIGYVEIEVGTMTFVDMAVTIPATSNVSANVIVTNSMSVLIPTQMRINPTLTGGVGIESGELEIPLDAASILTSDNTVTTLYSRTVAPGTALYGMEPRFGQDFGDVRVHRNAAASALTEDVKAKAFTVGSDVFFREGHFEPETQQGQHLIAHELTHVVQQREGMRSVQREIVQREVSSEAKDDPAKLFSLGFLDNPILNGLLERESSVLYPVEREFLRGVVPSRKARSRR